MKTHNGSNWQAANGGKRALGKHAGFQSEAETPSTKPAHTPTPWKLVKDGSDNTALSSDGRHITFICPVPTGPDLSWNEGRAQCEANAALIVRAVNSHAELVALLRAAQITINADALADAGRNATGHWVDCRKRTLDEITAVLAKAQA